MRNGVPLLRDLLWGLVPKINIQGCTLKWHPFGKNVQWRECEILHRAFMGEDKKESDIFPIRNTW